MAEPLHVFIDTNVWLSFYSFTNDDLEQLRTLIALIKAEKLKLYVDQHLADEFYRNRERKLAESIREFSDRPVAKGIPRYMRDYPEAKAYEEGVEAALKARDAMVTRTKEDAKAKGLAADKLFADILAVCPPKEITKAVFDAAVVRRLKGNPPGKYPSAGDQIHWEMLLKEVPEGVELHVVSKDGDFESKLNKGMADPFLFDEWNTKKKGELFLHNELRPFFNSKFPDIKLAVDVEKNEALSKLVNSGSFQMTHTAIEGLALFKNDLSWNDADALFTALMDNSQIRWISTDSDVKGFYVPLIEKYKNKIGDERHAELSAVFEKKEPQYEDWGDLDLDEPVPF